MLLNINVSSSYGIFLTVLKNLTPFYKRYVLLPNGFLFEAEGKPHIVLDSGVRARFCFSLPLFGLCSSCFCRASTLRRSGGFRRKQIGISHRALDNADALREIGPLTVVCKQRHDVEQRGTRDVLDKEKSDLKRIRDICQRLSTFQEPNIQHRFYAKLSKKTYT